ncbi:CsbD family protein [Niallia circulans]
MAENKHSIADKVKSGVSKVKGEVKDQIGNAKGDTSMQADGKKIS